jgi:hypothetical protein
MSRPCGCCRSENVDALDEALVAGASQSETARRFRVSRHALIRHRRHMGARRREREQLDRLAVAKGQPARNPAEELLEKIRRYERRLLRAVQRAERKGKNADIILGIRELARLAAMAAAGTGALQPTVSTNVGRMIAEAAARARAYHDEEAKRLKALDVRGLLLHAIDCVDEKKGGAYAAVSQALNALHAGLFPSLHNKRALMAAAAIVEPEPVDADVVEPAAPTDSVPLAEVVSIDRPRHQCSATCTPFSCSYKMESTEDRGDGPINWRDSKW